MSGFSGVLIQCRDYELAGCGRDAGDERSDTDANSDVDDYASREQVGATIEDNATIVTGIVDDLAGVSLDKQMLYRTTAALRNADETASPKMKSYVAPYSAVACTLEAIYAGEMDRPRTSTPAATERR